MEGHQHDCLWKRKFEWEVTNERLDETLLNVLPKVVDHMPHHTRPLPRIRWHGEDGTDHIHTTGETEGGRENNGRSAQGLSAKASPSGEKIKKNTILGRTCVAKAEVDEPEMEEAEAHP